MKLELSRQIFHNYSNTKLHNNSSIGSQGIPYGRTDGQAGIDKTNSSFSQFREERLKMGKMNWLGRVQEYLNSIFTQIKSGLNSGDVGRIGLRVLYLIIWQRKAQGLNVRYYYFACCFVWVQNLVSYIQERKKGVSEQDTVENVCD
jgi:hypothetical protein